MRNKIIMDFDGVFASNMIYDEQGKALKTFPWGIRHAVDILVDNGFDIYIITGDSTKNGQAITQRFCKNLKITEILFVKSHKKLSTLKAKFNLDECVYVGDDIYDIDIFRNTYAITTANAHSIFTTHLDFKSKYNTSDYFFMDMALHVLSKFAFNNMHPDDIADAIVKKSHQTSFVDTFIDRRFNKILFIQQYSMRNHSDETYNPLLDGNLNLTLHRIYGICESNSWSRFDITIPKNIDADQMEILLKFVRPTFADRITFIPIDYGINAYENRKLFNGKYGASNSYDAVISDFEGIDLSKHNHGYYNFNISQNFNTERWFIDSFFDAQYERVIKTDNQIFVLNENQKEFMLHDSFIEDKLTVDANVIVDSKISNSKFLKIQQNFFTSLLTSVESNKIKSTINKVSEKFDHVFFMPFRLSDPCYNFDGIVKRLFSASGKYAILITNPNDASIIEKTPDNVEIINIASDLNINKKSLYFSVLNEIVNHENISIPIYEDPEEVLHQSLIEMSILCPKIVNFISSDSIAFETLKQNKNNNYIQTLIY